MTRNWIAIAACVALLAGCGKKEADDAEKKSESAPEQAQKDVVQLSEQTLPQAHIETAVVAPGGVSVPLRAPGRISFDLNHTAKVTSTLEGRIQKMNYDVGALVKQDDVVAVIESPESFKPIELKAPMEGRIVERQGTVGELLDKAKSLYTISDLNTVWCIASVNENDIAAVRVGQAANLHVLAYPGEKFVGKVILFSDAVDEKTRIIEVRIEVGNPDGRLKSGMFATVSLLTENVANGLFVPDAAVQMVHGQPVVFVEERPGTYRAAKVTLGQQIGEMDEVLNGLSSGVRIVTSGGFLLKTELMKGELMEE